jgi:hypothetical protein
MWLTSNLWLFQHKKNKQNKRISPPVSQSTLGTIDHKKESVCFTNQNLNPLIFSQSCSHHPTQLDSRQLHPQQTDKSSRAALNTVRNGPPPQSLMTIGQSNYRDNSRRKSSMKIGTKRWRSNLRLGSHLKVLNLHSLLTSKIPMPKCSQSNSCNEKN